MMPPVLSNAAGVGISAIGPSFPPWAFLRSRHVILPGITRVFCRRCTWRTLARLTFSLLLL